MRNEANQSESKHFSQAHSRHGFVSGDDSNIENVLYEMTANFLFFPFKQKEVNLWFLNLNFSLFLHHFSAK